MRLACPEQRLDCLPISEVKLNLECRDEIIPILRALQHIYGDAELRRGERGETAAVFADRRADGGDEKNGVVHLGQAISPGYWVAGFLGYWGHPATQKPSNHFIVGIHRIEKNGRFEFGHVHLQELLGSSVTGFLGHPATQQPSNPVTTL